MLINGEKWACESCIKGHRVSGCQHADRDLHHINPKGRPVKQCEHCRGARKSKAHHAKCDCGDKKDHRAGDVPQCGCHHGKQCHCGAKKVGDLKLDTNAQAGAAKAKPRLTAAHSESTLTHFANGHHKPCHRLNNSAHTSGAPYKIPKAHTLHNMSQGNYPSTHGLPDFYSSNDYRRSADNLLYASASDSNLDYCLPQRSADSLPLGSGSPLNGPSNGLFDMQPLLYNSQQQADGLGSMSGSPIEPLASSGQVPLQQWPMQAYTPPMSNPYQMDQLANSPNADGLATPEGDWAIPSAGLAPSWSANDLPLDPNQLNGDLARPISHSGDSNPHSVPGLTSSPGVGSDMGDTGAFGDFDSFPQASMPETSMPEPRVFDNLLKFTNQPANRFSTGLLHEMSRPPTSSPDMTNRRSLDLDLLKRPDDDMYYLGGLPPTKDIPRTAPIPYGNGSSPDLTSMPQVTSPPPDFSSVTSQPRNPDMFSGFEADPTSINGFPSPASSPNLNLNYNNVNANTSLGIYADWL